MRVAHVTTPGLRPFIERLHGLLRDAYDEETLARLLLFKLGTHLSHISPAGAAFDTVVFRLVLWADQEGRLLELAREAAADRPARSDAKQLAEEMAAAHDPSASRPPPQPPSTEVGGIPNDVDAL